MVMHNVVSVDGFIVDARDDVGPLFEWYSNSDASLGGVGHLSQVSAEYVEPVWTRIGTPVTGRRLLDITNGW
ncbi:hypothetical protein [Streptomyces fructofermentans]|uniref:Uncharacterized protein n=1 Tax=Streptomyces fructofermentans TaxID=152141 RepID=A0A918KH98_9ACTN|nr:hypothetical protein GCM10010515_33880 [Streptomyces fructofermentans]